MVVYWPFLHGFAVDIVNEKVKDPKFNYFMHWHLILIHSVPFFTVFVNVMLSKMIFMREHSRYLVTGGCIYMVLNYIGTI